MHGKLDKCFFSLVKFCDVVKVVFIQKQLAKFETYIQIMKI